MPHRGRSGRDASPEYDRFLGKQSPDELRKILRSPKTTEKQRVEVRKKLKATPGYRQERRRERQRRRYERRYGPERRFGHRFQSRYQA